MQFHDAKAFVLASRYNQIMIEKTCGPCYDVKNAL
jgi:hypothetical protein